MPRRAILWIVLPLLPLLAGFVVLDVVNGTQTLDPVTGTIVSDTSFTPHLPALSDLHAADRGLRVFGGMATYVSVGLFHICACLAVIALMGLHIRRMEPASRQQALIVLGALAVLLAIISVAARQDGWNGALTLTYRNICALVHRADVLPDLMPKSCTGAGISLFAWAALLPYMFGLAAAACAAAVTSTAFRPLKAGDAPETLASRAALVEQTFHATAFVLVTSTITMMLFYQIPLPLIENPDALEQMTAYARSMTLFWGVVFSLTLVAIFGPGQLMLEDDGARPGQIPEALTPRGTRKQLTSTLTALAPLLIGASGTILEQLAGAL